MQGIHAKDHKILMEVFKKFEQLQIAVPDKISSEENAKIKEGMAEVMMLYVRFQELFHELGQCTKRYERQKKILQSNMYRNIRKMNSVVTK